MSMILVVANNRVQRQPAKTPKTATKLKLTTPKAPEDGGKKTPASKAKKASTKKGKAADEEAGGAQTKEPEKPVDPEQLKQKKEKEGMYSKCSLSPIFGQCAHSW